MSARVFRGQFRHFRAFLARHHDSFIDISLTPDDPDRSRPITAAKSAALPAVISHQSFTRLVVGFSVRVRARALSESFGAAGMWVAARLLHSSRSRSGH